MTLIVRLCTVSVPYQSNHRGDRIAAPSQENPMARWPDEVKEAEANHAKQALKVQKPASQKPTKSWD